MNTLGLNIPLQFLHVFDEKRIYYALKRILRPSMTIFDIMGDIQENHILITFNWQRNSFAERQSDGIAI